MNLTVVHIFCAISVIFSLTTIWLFVKTVSILSQMEKVLMADLQTKIIFSGDRGVALHANGNSKQSDINGDATTPLSTGDDDILGTMGADC